MNEVQRFKRIGYQFQFPIFSTVNWKLETVNGYLICNRSQVQCSTVQGYYCAET